MLARPVLSGDFRGESVHCSLLANRLPAFLARAIFQDTLIPASVTKSPATDPDPRASLL